VVIGCDQGRDIGDQGNETECARSGYNRCSRG
jgi:hypothetical protein